MKQQIFAEGDGAPILHGPEGEIRNGDQVHFGKRIGNVIIGFAKRQRFAAEFCPKACEFFHPRQGDNPYPVVFFIMGEFKFADAKEDEIG